MKKTYSTAIILAAACCAVLSTAATMPVGEKAEKVGKTFCRKPVERRNTEASPLTQPESGQKKISTRAVPSIEEITGAYRWSSFEYNYGSNYWTTRDAWINQVEDSDALTITFDTWNVDATYSAADGAIYIESGQLIGHDESNDIDIFFQHARWNEEGTAIEFQTTPLKIRVSDTALFVDADDIIYIGAETIDSGFYICADNNSFVIPGGPSGYTRVGNTLLFTCTNTNIDVYGEYNGSYYKSTFGNGGYKISMQVNDGSANQMDCSRKNTLDGVEFVAKVEQQGEFARICYLVSNNNAEDAIVSLGTHADVMIGSNDAAPITRRIDTLDQTYGLTMSNGYGAQLCVLFGAGLTGVNAVDDFWFGYYYLNSDPYNMVGNYSGGSNYMVENGSYDSGMGWCWKNRTIPAGQTVVFSYLIGVGDVNLEPNFSFAVTPEDPDGWNNLALPHQLTINGEYESPAGVDGRIEYAVEDSEEWTPLTDMLPSGTEFEGTMTVMFDESRQTHLIRFRTVDNVGNATILQPIEYIDVSYVDIDGIEERTYSGQPQTLEITSEQLGQDEFALAYINNVNAGTASFRLEGVFPYSIGRSAYRNFTINPLLLEDGITLEQDTYVFDNTPKQPAWSFVKTRYAELEAGRDYAATYRNNRFPGTGTVEVSGIGNYTGTFTQDFTIDKAPLAETLYTVGLPDSDIVYDGNAHTATFSGNEGVGTPTFVYRLADGQEAENTSEAGHYEVYLSVAEGDYYYGIAERYLGSFIIYNFDSTEWEALTAIDTQLRAAGLSDAWDMEAGITSVGTFSGLEIKEGHVVGVDLSSKGLSGEFPAALLTLPQLKKIDVSDNNLTGDLPTTLLALAAQDTVIAAAVDTLKIGGNEFSGNLGLVGQSLTSLVYLDASHNRFEDLYPALPENVRYLDIRGQRIERTVDLNLSNVVWDELKTQIPSIILYDPAAYGFTNQVGVILSTEELTEGSMPSVDRWALQLYISGSDIIPSVVGGNTYRGQSGDTLYVYCLQDGELNGTRFNVNLSFDQGDANFFNGIDASDLQATILYAFDAYSSMPFNFTAANTYPDEVINVQDVTCTVNILLSMLAQDPALLPGIRKVGGIDERLTEASITLSEGKVILRSERPVSALTVKASGNVEWLTGRYGLTQSVAGSNVVAYSLAGSEIPAGETVIGEYSGDAEILYASLSDAEAMPVSVSVKSGVENGVDELPFEIDDDCEIYDVMGIRHQRLIEGLNIIVRDGKTVRYYNTK